MAPFNGSQRTLPIFLQISVFGPDYSPRPSTMLNGCGALCSRTGLCRVYGCGGVGWAGALKIELNVVFSVTSLDSSLKRQCELRGTFIFFFYIKTSVSKNILFSLCFIGDIEEFPHLFGRSPNIFAPSLDNIPLSLCQQKRLAWACCPWRCGG